MRDSRPTAPRSMSTDETRQRHGARGGLPADGRLDGVENLSTSRRSRRPKSVSAAASDCRSSCWRRPGPTASRAAASATAARSCGSPSSRSLEAGFSTVDIGGILSNVANKFLLEGFFAVERTWRNICAVRNVSDFKTVTSYRLIGKDQYEQVAPGRRAQARHAGRGDLHQQGRHLRPAAVHRPPGHHQRRPGRHHHRAPEARPRLGPEDQRRLLERRS